MSRRSKASALCLVAAWLLAACSPAAPVPDPAEDAATRHNTDLEKRIDAFQSGFDAANRLSGVLLVVKGGNVLLHRAYGTANPESGLANKPGTRFAIASITKILTAVVVDQLAEEKKLSIDDSLARWVPDFPQADSITVRHLLEHRAGIPHRVTTMDEETLRYTAAEIVSRAARHPLVFVPGSANSYSTAGYALVARVVEQVEGQSFAEVLKRRVFQPAAMASSYDLTEPEGMAPPAPSYVPAHGKLVPAPARDLSCLVGGGSVVSTAQDLLSFLRALMEGKLAPARLENIIPAGRVQLAGATNGYFAWADVLPEEDLIVVYLGNTWGGAGPALRETLPALVRGESPAPPAIPPAIVAPPEAKLREYAGRYEIRPGAVHDVLPRGGDLLLADNYLVPIGEDRFWQPAWSLPVQFVRDASGVVVALERQGADVRRWPRVPSGD